MLSDWVQVVEKGSAVILVLGLLGLFVWALRRKGFAQMTVGRAFLKGPRRLSVVERLPLTAQHSLYLVQIADQLLLLGSSPGGINLIDTPGPKHLPARAPEPQQQARLEL